MSATPGAPPPPFVAGSFPTLQVDFVRVNVFSMNFIISFGQIRTQTQSDGATQTVIVEVGRFSLSPLSIVYLIRGLMSNVKWYNTVFGQLPDPEHAVDPEVLKSAGEQLTNEITLLKNRKK